MYASFEGPNEVKLKDNDGNEKKVTANHILIAVGGRPTYLDIEGCKEYC